MGSSQGTGGPSAEEENIYINSLELLAAVQTFTKDLADQGVSVAVEDRHHNSSGTYRVQRITEPGQGSVDVVSIAKEHPSHSTKPSLIITLLMQSLDSFFM